MRDVSDNEFKVFEIYPNIYVYKNVFKDIKKTYSLLKDSNENPEGNFYNTWSPWSEFGEYISPPTDKFSNDFPFDMFEKYGNMDKAIAETDRQKEQKEALLEVIDLFHSVTRHYAKRHNVDIDEETIVKTYTAGDRPLWIASGPTICKYNVSAEYDSVTMSYHTDYRREDAEKPDYKFVITALAYFNDDYEGGEIDFVVNKKLLKYKPSAGDYLVFPSGHPDYLTKDGSVYLHGVLPTKKTNKYFSRMFWQKHYEGSKEWFENEKKYGRDKWLEMQPGLENQYRLSHPHKPQHNGERLQ